MISWQLKRMLLLLMILFVSCLMLFINTSSNDSSQPAIESSVEELNEIKNRNNIELFFEGVHQVQYDTQGNKKLELTSNSVTEFKNGKKDLQQPIFYLFNSPIDEISTNEYSWKIESNYAQINDDIILELYENVTITKPNESDFKFQTQQLDYNLVKNLASGKEDANFFRGNTTGSATGFDINLNSNKLDIQLHNNVVFHSLDEAK